MTVSSRGGCASDGPGALQDLRPHRPAAHVPGPTRAPGTLPYGVAQIRIGQLISLLRGASLGLADIELVLREAEAIAVQPGEQKWEGRDAARCGQAR